MQWIKCSQKLPKERDMVLLYSVDAGVCCGHLYITPIEKNDRVHIFNFGIKPLKTITHWMPLPPAPEN